MNYWSWPQKSRPCLIQHKTEATLAKAVTGARDSIWRPVIGGGWLFQRDNECKSDWPALKYCKIIENPSQYPAKLLAHANLDSAAGVKEGKGKGNFDHNHYDSAEHVHSTCSYEEYLENIYINKQHCSYGQKWPNICCSSAICGRGCLWTDSNFDSLQFNPKL